MKKSPFSTLTGLVSFDHVLWQAENGNSGWLISRLERGNLSNLELGLLADFLEGRQFGHLPGRGRPTKRMSAALRGWNAEKPLIVEHLRGGRLEPAHEITIVAVLINFSIGERSRRGHPNAPSQRATDADLRLRRGEFDYEDLRSEGRSAEEALQIASDRNHCTYEALALFVSGSSSKRHRN
ncbi:hypothetical protein [Mesorhizobium sp. M0159]|uniref:hypothetical protein n=1 Tax=Mesorhizobium sp. M0159 TaxID=2956900 RepID=UPI00333B0960